jgi:hypothetical protein
MPSSRHEVLSSTPTTTKKKEKKKIPKRRGGGRLGNSLKKGLFGVGGEGVSSAPDLELSIQSPHTQHVLGISCPLCPALCTE